MKKLSYLLVLFLLLGQTSCKKEKEKSVEEYLTYKGGFWKGVSYKITENGQVTDQGTLDRNFFFKDDGRYSFTKHDGLVIQEGDWSLQNNDKEIELDPDLGYNYTLYIDDIDIKSFECHRTSNNTRTDLVFEH